MKLSTRGRYGLMAMVDLAATSSGDHVSLNIIAERQNISGKYLEQVFSLLRKAGLVKSVKGAQGGYILSDEAANIKVGTILRALEGNLNIVDEDTDCHDASAKAMKQCLKTNVWDRIDRSLKEAVDSLTLEDLANDYKKNCRDGAMYYI